MPKRQIENVIYLDDNFIPVRDKEDAVWMEIHYSDKKKVLTLAGRPYAKKDNREDSP